MRTSPRTWSTLLLAPLVALIWAPVDAAAQAICSAPHSSPTLAQSGAIRTLPQGGAWLQISAAGTRSTEGFNKDGDRQEFLSNSEFRTASLFLTGSVGVLEGLELWGQVPVHNLRVEADDGTSTSKGVGDIRAAVRVSPALAGWSSIPVALRFGVKVPGSDFPVDARELPLTEGQSDVEVSLETGWSSTSTGIYLVGWAGYRWRFEDTEARHEPGNERFGHVAVGGAFKETTWEVGFDGLWGETPTQLGLDLPISARRLLQIAPTIGRRVGIGQLEFTAPIPVIGRNLPSGPGVSVGYRLTRGLS